MVKQATLILPIPPSVNQLYRNVRGKGRVKTHAYGAWIDTARKELLTQERVQFYQPVAIDIQVGLANKRLRDLDNMLKPLLDTLTGAGILEGDDWRRVEDLRIRLGDVAAGTVQIAIRTT